MEADTGPDAPTCASARLRIAFAYPALLRRPTLSLSSRLHHLRKVSALFTEFEETGMNKNLGYNSAAGLWGRVSEVLLSMVTPYIGKALQNLRMTQEGKLWVAHLYSYVFAKEHNLPTLGAECRRQ